MPQRGGSSYAFGAFAEILRVSSRRISPNESSVRSNRNASSVSMTGLFIAMVYPNSAEVGQTVAALGRCNVRQEI